MIAKLSAIATARRSRRPLRAGLLANTFGVTSRVGRLVSPERCEGGFTLAELLVSVFVLVIIIFMVAQLLTSATAVTRTGHKHINTDTQARVALDRMALDLAQMMKRTDIDYYVKGLTSYSGHGNGHGWGHQGGGDLGSDQLAFFSQVPGYYPAGTQSPISLVAYRVNQSNSTSRAYLKLERLGKGLLWNGASNSIPSMVFLPVTIGSLWPAAINNNNNCGGSGNSSCDADYEIVGPGIFRFEYYYILKNGRATDVPWNTDAGHTSTAGIGLGDIEAIGVTVAVIDSTARAMIDAANSGSLLDLANDFADFKTSHGRGVGQATRYIGELEANWETTIENVVSTGATSTGLPIPREAAKAIRIYGRSLDLKTLATF